MAADRLLWRGAEKGAGDETEGRGVPSVGRRRRRRRRRLTGAGEA